MYAPAAIVYRDYMAEDGTVINLFIGPEPVGWDTPAICAAYKGANVMYLTVRPVPEAASLRLNEIVLAPAGRTDQMTVCGYYWRTAEGTVNDVGLNVLTGKFAALAGQSAFRVDMCTDVADSSQRAAASERLSKFAAAVDPELRKLVREAAQSQK